MLFLVPSPLSQTRPSMPILGHDLPQVRACRTWIVENAKPARAALRWFEVPMAIRDLEIIELSTLDISARIQLIERCKQGEPMALMSDAGCPGIADPGAELVLLAHEQQCPVFPLVGPSSIVLALMGSGLNGQNFHFHGYLPVEQAARSQTISSLEKTSLQHQTTQIVIETPFRNQKLLETLVGTLKSETLLCVASDLTGNQESIITWPVSKWKETQMQLDKIPTLFLWLAAQKKQPH